MSNELYYMYSQHASTLIRSAVGQVPPQKLRLVAVAFCRIVWPQLDDQQRGAALTAEQYARGLVDNHSLTVASAYPTTWQSVEHLCGSHACHWDPLQAALLALQDVGERCRQEETLGAARCVLGTPWEERQLQPVRGQLPRDVLDLARSVSDRCTDDPVAPRVLADALEEAGCPETQTVTRPCRVSVVATLDGWRVKQDHTAVYLHRHRSLAARWASFRYGVTSWNKSSRCWSGEGRHTTDVPHPVLYHLREPCRHYQGCWAIDWLLSKHS